MLEAGSEGLAGMLVEPLTAGKHPLVIMTHRHALGAAQREMGPGAMWMEASWFARRGWAVAIVLRRGFGASGGTDSEKDLGKVRYSEAEVEALYETDAGDLRAAYTALRTYPEVDDGRIIAVGCADGGAAAMWLAETSPTGLKAVINFAGGFAGMPDWAIKGPVHLIPDVIEPLYKKLGAETYIPMLWLYPKRNVLFPLKDSQAAYAAFTSAGGVAEMHVLQHPGSLEEDLFDENPREWGPMVEAFLAHLGLPSAETLPATPDPTGAMIPANLSESARKGFVRYWRHGPAKAFAYSYMHEAWGYATGKRDVKTAETEAMEHCIAVDCVIVTRTQ